MKKYYLFIIVACLVAVGASPPRLGVPQGLPRPISQLAAGSTYTLTDSAAALNFGTTDPAIVLTSSGTWHIRGLVKLSYAGATVSTESATLTLRRTNNTAADLTDDGSTILGVGTTTLDLPVSTTLTHDYMWVPLDIYYTTANKNDAITINGGVSATLGAGTINATAAWIVAERLP